MTTLYEAMESLKQVYLQKIKDIEEMQAQMNKNDEYIDKTEEYKENGEG